jgi:hypothetical protein
MQSKARGYRSRKQVNSVRCLRGREPDSPWKPSSLELWGPESVNIRDDLVRQQNPPLRRLPILATNHFERSTLPLHVRSTIQSKCSTRFVESEPEPAPFSQYPDLLAQLERLPLRLN